MPDLHYNVLILYIGKTFLKYTDEKTSIDCSLINNTKLDDIHSIYSSIY